jgi:hypothetical protein
VKESGSERKTPGYNRGPKAGLALRKHRELAPDSKIREIAERGLPLPEAAALAGLARTNYRRRAQMLGYDVKPGRSGRPSLYHACRIPGCTEPHSSNGLCRAHFNKWYYRQKADKFKERAAKQREASRQQVSREELEHLRRPENRGESLGFGPDKKIVHLACGWIGDDLTHHIRHCPIKPEGWSAYSRHWGFDPSRPPVSPKQSEAYSKTQRMNWASFKRRSTMARNRWGKGTGPRLQQRKVSDSTIYEIFGAGLSVTEAAKRAGMSRIGFYKRAQNLGLDIGAPRRQQLQFVRFAFDLNKWIALQQPQIPTAEQFTQHMDDLRSGSLRPSPQLPSPGLLLLFMTHLKAELQERPEWILEIAAEIAEKKPAQKVLRLANRVFQRARTMREPSKESKHAGRPTGMTEERIKEGRELEKLIEKYGGKRGAIKKAAIEVYRGVRPDLAYDRARQTRKDYRRWKTTNREKN